MQHRAHSPLAPLSARLLGAAALALASGCVGADGSKPEVVAAPSAGTYVGTLELERRTYAGGVRVDRKTCGATFVAVVDPAGSPWLELDAEACDLGGLVGTVRIALTPLDGMTPTGSPMGHMGGDLPEGTWEGTFLDDGSFSLTGSASSDAMGVSTEWDLVVEAQDLAGLLGDDTGG